MSVRWCWLGSHEIPEGAPAVRPPRESSYICVPCSETERGKFVMQMRKDRFVVASRYVGNNWSRMYAEMGTREHIRKRHGG